MTTQKPINLNINLYNNLDKLREEIKNNEIKQFGYSSMNFQILIADMLRHYESFLLSKSKINLQSINHE